MRTKGDTDEYFSISFYFIIKMMSFILVGTCRHIDSSPHPLTQLTNADSTMAMANFNEANVLILIEFPCVFHTLNWLAKPNILPSTVLYFSAHSSAHHFFIRSCRLAISFTLGNWFFRCWSFRAQKSRAHTLSHRARLFHYTALILFHFYLFSGMGRELMSVYSDFN